MTARSTRWSPACISPRRALLALDHEAIPKARDLLRHGDGRAFIVMDLLHGETLAQALGLRGALAPDTLATLGRRIAGALRAVHAAGLVHGDVSPENVMLCGGVAGAVLIDFGVVRETGAATPDVEFAGKWSVAAPEQLAGEPGEPGGPPADLYALGLPLACAAKGERLPMGKDRESARTAWAGLTDLGIGGKVGRLVRDLVQADPQKRPNAEEDLKRLEGGLGGWFRG